MSMYARTYTGMQSHESLSCTCASAYLLRFINCYIWHALVPVSTDAHTYTRTMLVELIRLYMLRECVRDVPASIYLPYLNFAFTYLVLQPQLVYLYVPYLAEPFP